MAILLGVDGDLYIGDALAENVKDVTLSLETSEADVTTRKSNGWRATKATLKEATLEFEMLVDDDDSSYTTVADAFIENTVLGMKVVVGGSAFTADFSITGFSINQALEEAQSVSVTAKPTSGDAPTWGANSATE